jgi:hypothetical protein
MPRVLQFRVFFPAFQTCSYLIDKHNPQIQVTRAAARSDAHIGK